MAKIAFTLLIFTVLNGCSSTNITNKNDFIYNSSYVQILDDTEFMPSKGMLKRKTLKAAILPAKILSPALKASSVVPIINNNVTQLLLDAGVDVIDRQSGDIAREELKAYEDKGLPTGLIIDVADVLISPVIVSATYDAVYTPPYYSGKGKERKWHSAQCEHKTEVNGHIKVYNMPLMDHRKQIELERNITFRTETRKRDCRISTAMMNDFMATTVKDAIRNKANAIRNEFSPYGYVLDYRKVEDSHYIQINQGSELEIDQNQNIEFIRVIENRDNLSGEITRNDFVMGRGKTTDIIHKNSAWVEVSQTLARKIKRGDKVKVHFKTGYFN
jgi:hypothetical protein